MANSKENILYTLKDFCDILNRTGWRESLKEVCAAMEWELYKPPVICGDDVELIIYSGGKYHLKNKPK